MFFYAFFIKLEYTKLTKLKNEGEKTFNSKIKSASGFWANRRRCNRWSIGGQKLASQSSLWIWRWWRWPPKRKKKWSLQLDIEKSSNHGEWEFRCSTHKYSHQDSSPYRQIQCLKSQVKLEKMGKLIKTHPFTSQKITPILIISIVQNGQKLELSKLRSFGAQMLVILKTILIQTSEIQPLMW